MKFQLFFLLLSWIHSTHPHPHDGAAILISFHRNRSLLSVALQYRTKKRQFMNKFFMHNVVELSLILLFDKIFRRHPRKGSLMLLQSITFLWINFVLYYSNFLFIFHPAFACKVVPERCNSGVIKFLPLVRKKNLIKSELCGNKNKRERSVKFYCFPCLKFQFVRKAAVAAFST